MSILLLSSDIILIPKSGPIIIT